MANPKGNIQNLKPWKPGESGNPDGRSPKGEALTDILRSKLDKEAVAEKLIQIAMEKEDLTALRYIFDRIDGKPKEKHEVEGTMPTVIFNGIEEPE
jgi:hypothetical protein